MHVYGYDATFDGYSFAEELSVDVDLKIRMNCAEFNAFTKVNQLGIIDENGLKKSLTNNMDNACSKTVNPRFGGAFFIDGKYVYIKNIIVNKPAVIVFWSDDTKTKAVCDEKDTFDPNFGLTLATLKKFAGSEATSKLFEDWGLDSKEEKANISLRDLRKKEKEAKQAESFMEGLARFSALAAEVCPVFED